MDDFSADTSTTAFLNVNSSLSGSIDANGDNDWIRLSLYAGVTYTIDVGGYSTNGMGLLDPVIEGLRNANGAGIPNTYRDDGPEDSLDPQLVFTPTATGNYFLWVRSYANRGTGAYTVTLSSNNAPPSSSAGQSSMTEDGVLQGQLPPASDADGDAISYSVQSQPTYGQVVVGGNGAFTYTPISNFSGPDSFLFKVTDSRGAATVYTMAINVAAVNDDPTGTLSIVGNAAQGQTLSLSSTVADADGIPSSGSGAVSYQWKAAGVAIAGATGSSFLVTANEVSKPITVTATYTDGGGTLETVTSAATVPVTAAGAVQGVAYHWKSHMLLAGVNVSLSSPSGVQANVGEMFDLRAARFDATSSTMSVEVWANGGTASFGSFDFRATSTGATSAIFTSALSTHWGVQVNTEDPGNVLVAGMSTTGASGSVKLGTLQLTFAPGVTITQVAFSQVKVGTADGANQGLALQARTTALADGAYSFTSLGADAVQLSVARATTDTGNFAITSADALAALRLSVGLNPNPDPDGSGPLQAPAVSPYQIMAADVNNSGTVTATDALLILRMAVKLPTAPAQEWFFVEEKRDLWNEAANNGQGAFSLTRTSASWDRTITADPTGGPVNLVAVLKGDVNGSWTAPPGSQDLDALFPTYFDDLALLLGVPEDQWGAGP
jgi:hypothetical protein